jgi:hypothetical protein
MLRALARSSQRAQPRIQRTDPSSVQRERQSGWVCMASRGWGRGVWVEKSSGSWMSAVREPRRGLESSQSRTWRHRRSFVVQPWATRTETARGERSESSFTKQRALKHETAHRLHLKGGFLISCNQAAAPLPSRCTYSPTLHICTTTVLPEPDPHRIV